MAARSRPRIVALGFAAALALALLLPSGALAATHALTITTEGPGSGTVQCALNGDPPGPCAAQYEAGAEVTVSAEEDEGSEFLEFGGDCGPLSCEVEMDEDHTVSVLFETLPSYHSLHVVPTGGGWGEVLCKVEGHGPGECADEYEAGTALTLIAQAEAGSEFDGWGGACEGASGTECDLEMDSGKEVEADFELSPEAFALTIEESGEGEVICEREEGPEPCEETYPEGSTVYLIAQAKPGSEFLAWEGECEHVFANECKVELDGARAVKARFKREAGAEYKLSVSKTGTGSGTVTSSPAGINCGSGAGCEHEYEEGVEVTLSQSASPGSEFKEWTGACTGSGVCKVTMTEAKNVGAVFNLIPKPKFKLTVSKLGGGSGTVTSTPAGINCGSGAGCEAEFEEGVEVELHETPTTGTFKEWGGACSGAGTCKVTMSAAKSVTAKFVKSYKLTVSKTGSGSGKVTSAPAGISCGGSCEHEYEEGVEVTLNPEASTGDEFIEWGGACTGSGACKVTMSSAKSVSARFEPEPPPFLALTVTKLGSGTGAVTSTPAGIDCGATCSHEFEKATTVELHQEASPGSEFIEWGGACTGSGNCKVKMNLAKEVTARFEPALTPSHTLTIQISGTGSGTVICDGGACAASYSEGTKVTLAAIPASGSTFTGWSGACSGTGSCEVTISADTTVGAAFASNPEPPASSEAEVSSDRAPFEGNSAQIPLSCPAPGFCTGVLNLYTRLPSTHSRHQRRNSRRHHKRSRLTLIGSQAFSLTPGQSATIPVKVTNPKARRMLKLGATLVVRVTGTGVKTRVIRLEGQRRGRGGRGRG